MDAMIRSARAALLDAGAVSLLARAKPAICDPTRAQIVRALSIGPLPVTDLTRVIGRQRTVTSQHLRVLREAGLVETRREGRMVVYRLARVKAIRVAQATLDAVAGAR
jgi:ArsR family transcriptional regulator, lead/cadmium/zinc/bismuth-responsive transcriptional repressor